MWHKTRLTEQLGLQYPIVQGPFGGGTSSPALAATVARAGGLGSYGAMALKPEEIIAVCNEIRALTDRPFAMNIWVSREDEGARDPAMANRFSEAYAPLSALYAEQELPAPSLEPIASLNFAEQAEALLEAAPPVFSFIYGVPDSDLLERFRSKGIALVGGATTVDEAMALDEAGVDAIVASGFEAGGHRMSFLRSAESSLMGTLSLVPQVVDSVKAPVIAAGGIADGRGIAAVLALGASAAQIGTAFLACDESNASAHHRETLHSPRAWNTVLTRAFSGRLARGLANPVSEAYETSGVKPLPYPLQAQLARPLRESAQARGDETFTNLWSGQSARLVKEHSAGVLFQRLVDEADATVRRLSQVGTVPNTSA